MSYSFLLRTISFKDVSEAKREMRLIGSDEVGVQLMGEKALFEAIKVTGVLSPAANIIKQDILSLGGDAVVGRDVVSCKVANTDVLLLGTRKQLKRLAKKLRSQPFGLAKLGEDLLFYLKNEERKNGFKLELPGKILSLGERTYVMGILNVTPDSFSDSGEFLDREAALRQTERMVSDGVDMIDVGGESSRPGAEPVSLEEELTRVVPVIREILKRFDVPISVDTYKSEVARQALDAGATLINDISALRFDEKMAPLAAEYNVPVVLMHMLGTPRDMQLNPTYQDVIGEIYAFLSERVEFAQSTGIAPGNIIVDPGIGFGKRFEDNLEIIRRLGEFRSLGFPVLVGPSRKAFIGKILDLPSKERFEGTLAVVALSAAGGANIVRVHDVKETVRVVKVVDACCNPGGRKE